MKMNKKSYNVIIVGIISMIITILMFMLINNSKIYYLKWLSLAFIILSEICFFIGIAYITVNKSKINRVFINSGTLVVLCIYWILTVFCAIFVNLFRYNPCTFLIIEALIILVSAAIIILLNIFSSKIDDNDINAIKSSNCGMSQPKKGGF